MAPSTTTFRVGISACLLGQEVRYDRGHKRDRFLTDELGPWVEWVPVCPEVEIGLGIPREAIRLEGSPEGPRLVGVRSHTDHSAAMQRFARTRTNELVALELRGYVLKKDSPSCGMARVKLYHDDGRIDRSGVGAFAATLMRQAPLLPVEEEGRLCDARLRENFVERLFAYDRWLHFRADRLTRGGLVAFHTVHKYQIMAHAPEAYRTLGRLVATAKSRPLRDVASEYGLRFMTALATIATPGRHANVMEHLAGYLSEHLDAADRAELHDLVRRYRQGQLPLVVPLTLLRHHLRRHALAYVLGQTYLDPHPAELMLRNHV